MCTINGLKYGPGLGVLMHRRTAELPESTCTPSGQGLALGIFADQSVGKQKRELPRLADAPGKKLTSSIRI